MKKVIESMQIVIESFQALSKNFRINFDKISAYSRAEEKVYLAHHRWDGIRARPSPSSLIYCVIFFLFRPAALSSAAV